MGPDKSELKLNVVLRTHNLGNVHGDQRYCGVDKSTLMLKCVSSLIHSMNQVTEPLKLTILDDRSDERFLPLLVDRVIPHSVHPVVLKQLIHGGQNSSALAQFQHLRDSQGLVYSIEDDYLHEPTSLAEMLTTYAYFKKKYEGMAFDVALYPFDMPDSYVPPWQDPCIIEHGPKRYWRTGHWSTFTMMLDANVVRRHWDQFDLLAREYGTPWGRANNIHEGTTLARIWKGTTRLLSPLPSLALHMQNETQRDPYYDWQGLWDSIPDFKDLPLPSSGSRAGLVERMIFQNERSLTRGPQFHVAPTT